MRYVSTRGIAPVLGFEDVLLTGLARDGGLYVPESWPRFDAGELRAMRGLTYAELAVRVMRPFLDDAIDEAAFARIVAETYAAFDCKTVAPLRQIGRNEWLLELFHGPTLAFKDFALQLLGRLFDDILARRGERVTVVGATSGDTGSAAIAACRDRAGIDIFILHPKDRISEVQRRQMTTVLAPNVHNLAIEGTFDDCQDLVKAMFNDAGFRKSLRLSAVNSINWARIMAQTVYYFAAALALGTPDRPIAFSVPTGNFGDVFAGYAAYRMGLPIARLIVATNANDILARFFASGEISVRPVVPTLSPAMDIQVSSNFERLLFEMHGRDGRTVSQAMQGFRATGSLHVPREALTALRRLFGAGRADDEATCRTIGRVWEESGILVDPHGAVGIAVGRACHADPSVPLVTLATAHPAKFPEAVERATGIRPALPSRLSDLMDRPERMNPLANDLGRVEEFLRSHARIAEVA